MVGRGCRWGVQAHCCHARGEVLQQFLLLSFSGKAEVCDLVLESDQQLCEVIVELGAFLKVAFQLHKSIISSCQAFEGLLSAATLTTTFLYEGLVEVLHFCNDLLLLPNAVGHLMLQGSKSPAKTGQTYVWLIETARGCS